MSACVAWSHNAGLFSLINKVVSVSPSFDHVHVDFSKGPCLYGEPGENVWNHLFEPTMPPEGEFTEVPDYIDWSMTAANAGRLYESAGDWRWKCNESWRRFKVREELVNEAKQFVEKWQRDVVGILVRCNGHSREQLSERSQPLDEYAAEFERIRKTGSIMHVMAGDWMTLKWFQARFPVSFDSGIRRTDSRDDDQLLHGRQSVEDAKKCLVEVLILSHCRALIHPVSNMATAALYINPALESSYLR